MERRRVATVMHLLVVETAAVVGGWSGGGLSFWRKDGCF